MIISYFSSSLLNTSCTSHHISSITAILTMANWTYIILIIIILLLLIVSLVIWIIAKLRLLSSAYILVLVWTLLFRLDSAQFILMVIAIYKVAATTGSLIHHAIVIVIRVFLILLESHMIVYIIIGHVAISRTIHLWLAHVLLILLKWAWRWFIVTSLITIWHFFRAICSITISLIIIIHEIIIRLSIISLQWSLSGLLLRLILLSVIVCGVLRIINWTIDTSTSLSSLVFNRRPTIKRSLRLINIVLWLLFLLSNWRIWFVILTWLCICINSGGLWCWPNLSLWPVFRIEIVRWHFWTIIIVKVRTVIHVLRIFLRLQITCNLRLHVFIFWGTCSDLFL